MRLSGIVLAAWVVTACGQGSPTLPAGLTDVAPIAAEGKVTATGKSYVTVEHRGASWMAVREKYKARLEWAGWVELPRPGHVTAACDDLSAGGCTSCFEQPGKRVSLGVASSEGRVTVMVETRCAGY